jgi:RNA polymerase sigma-70 factor (ECF subfamily)
MAADRRRARFDEIYRELAPRVAGYCRRRTDPEEAREVLAETFVIAWRKLEAIPHEAPLPWLLSTARKVLANRRRMRRAEAPLPEASVPDHADDVAGLLDLHRAFSQLSPEDRDTLALIAWDGLAVADAAVVAGCTVGTFSVRLHRARKRLAALLEPVTAVGGDR